MSLLRNIGVGGQGLLRGVASGVASLADIPSALGNVGVAAINVFKEDNLEYFEGYNFGGRAAEAVTFDAMRPKNDTERVIFAGTQAVGEVGSLVVASIATAGAGAAVGAGLVASRGASAARLLNPLVVTTKLDKAMTGVTVGATGLRANNIFEEDESAANIAQEITVDAAASILSDSNQRNEDLKEALEGIYSEFADINKALEDNGLTSKERQSYLDRIGQLNQADVIIQEVLSGDLTDSLISDRMQRLKEIIPEAFKEEQGSIVSPVTDRGHAALSIQAPFIQGVEGSKGAPEALAWDSPKLGGLLGGPLDAEPVTTTGNVLPRVFA